jgi:hypothetical protein
MEIITVKIQTQNGEPSGYLVNGNTFFPKENCELINQWIAEGNKPEPEFTEEELQAKELAKQIQEANSYLKETDWVETYKLRHDLGLELIPEDSSKWEVINKREEYIEFLKGAN